MPAYTATRPSSAGRTCGSGCWRPDGIFIPGSTEANAVREVAANMGQNLGTTISITNQSAGDQILSELGRGAIQGLSQYISKKMREEKVHLKSGYELMLCQKDNQ